jgi:hypothetical protein
MVKSKGEVDVLKYRKFSELNISSNVNAMAKSYIDSWINQGEDDYYVNLALGAFRNLYTFNKNQKPAISHHSEVFLRTKRHELVEPTRFDVMEASIKKSSFEKNLFN